ncbi:putative ribonuclease H-like domain-containing protein [Tanacetum coccineum]
MMHKKFQMSSMGELTFFLGVQVKQKEDGIFISQDKYVTDILKKFGFSDVKTANTPISLCSKMQMDSPFDLVAYTVSDYAGASLDRKSTTGGCQFLRCRLISWQCKKHIVVANSTTEAEYVAASSCHGQSTICIVKNPIFHSKTKHIEIRHHFIRDSNEKKLIQMIKIHTDKNVTDLLTKAFDFWATAKVETVNGEVQLQALVYGKKVIITETSVRRNLQLEDAEGIECLPNADIFEQLTLIGYEKPSQKLTFYKAFFSPQWKFLIHTILQYLSAKSTAWNEFSSTMASAIICLATNQKFNFSKYIFESMVKNVESSVEFLMYPSGPTEPISDEAPNEDNVPTQSNDPPLSRVNTLGSGEDRHKLIELMDLSGKEKEVKNSKDEKIIQSCRSAYSWFPLKMMVWGESGGCIQRGGGIDDINKDAEVTFINETQGRYDDAQMFNTDVFNGEEVFIAEQSEEVVEEVVSTAKVNLVQKGKPCQSTTTTTPSTIPKAKSITFRDPVESTTRPTLTLIPSNIKDKGKAKMIKPEEPLKMKEQIRLDEELAFKLQAEEEEQARLARDGGLLAERLQAREQKLLTDEEKARLFVELLEKRKIAALRAQEKRNKPPAKAQKKSTMVNMFVDMDTELVKESSKKAEEEMAPESSSKRAGEELEQEVEKKQKSLGSRRKLR